MFYGINPLNPMFSGINLVNPVKKNSVLSALGPASVCGKIFFSLIPACHAVNQKIKLAQSSASLHEGSCPCCARHFRFARHPAGLWSAAI